VILRATIEAVPYGDEELKRLLWTFNISNVREIRDLGFGHVVCEYKVVVTDSGGELIHEFIIPEFDRRDGSVALVSLATKTIEENI
jgi:hypothetical protein